MCNKAAASTKFGNKESIKKEPRNDSTPVTTRNYSSDIWHIKPKSLTKKLRPTGGRHFT